jgi:hypothetical protein
VNKAKAKARSVSGPSLACSKLCHYKGVRQMTFDIPDDVAEDFIKDAPEAEDRSRELTRLLRRHLTPTLTGEQWQAICEAANNDPETQAI